MIAKKTVLIVSVLAGVGILIGLFALVYSNDRPATARSVSGGPVPVAPLDGLTFVDAGLTLRWEWSPGLRDGQTYAVRVWYEDAAPRETWTSTTTFDARESIDSYAQELGTFYWQVAVVEYSDKHGFEGMGSAWSAVQTLHRVRRVIPTAYPPEQQSAVARFVWEQGFTTHTEIIDFVRSFIAQNSRDDAQDDFAPDYGDALAQLYAHYRGEADPPRLLCDGQATAMLTLLKELGIESRLIYLYGDNSSGVQEHTVLEVFNPDTQWWEVHDVLRNLYLANASTGGRISIEQAIFGPLEQVAACDAEGQCSQEQLRPDRRYLEAFRYGHSDTFWVNPDRFDLSKRFPDNGGANLSEYLTGNSREFIFRLESWK